MTETTTTGEPAADSRRTARRAALLVAGGVFAIQLVQALLLGAIDSVALAGIPEASSALVQLWSGRVFGAFTTAIPFALGVGLSLWLLAPLRAQLRMPQLVARSALAAVVGSVLTIAVVVVASFFRTLTGTNFFGNAFPDLGNPLRAAWFEVLAGVTGAFRDLVFGLPVVVLVALLVWGWYLRRDAAAQL